ncbi:MAG: GNAT family N-acetyltransferase [Chitinophagaceae bacterium]|jgi:GNAT superfamily N-acetyltransferase|nr:GNAT family N-acetyltransferase [Chitinophagaceae bacterium]
MIELIAYQTRYHREFKSLNLEWLDKYNLTESHDLEVLNDPEGTVIARGGCIFLAKEGDEIIGTAGLWKESEEEYELVKMTVAPAYRGKGISKLLLERCLSAAKELGAEKIILYSNSQLKTALGLYEKFGFRHVPVTGAPFLTADVKMELSLAH